MREGLKKAGAKLLEPIMKVEVVTPEEYTGGVIGDLTSPSWHGAGSGQPRQRERHQRHGAAGQHVRLHQHLRSMSSGRAEFTMQFDHYDAVPQNISDEIQKKYA